MKIRSSASAFMAFSALLAVVFGAAWGYIAYESYAMKAEIASISAAANAASANTAYLLSLKDSLRDAKDDLQAIDGRFIAKDGIPAFIDGLEGKARSAGVKADLGSLNLDESGDNSLPHTLAIHITGSGAWKNAVGYLASLESLPYAFRMDGVSLSRSVAAAAAGDKKAPAEPVWDFNADVVVYVAN